MSSHLEDLIKPHFPLSDYNHIESSPRDSEPFLWQGLKYLY